MSYVSLNETGYAPYYLEGDKAIEERIEETYSSAIPVHEAFWAEADVDSRFKAGDQTLWNDLYGNLPAYSRRQFNFNRIRRICNMIGGYQRRNRKSTISVGRENSDDETASQLSELLSWSMQNDKTYDTISSAFDGAVTTGMNLLNVWMDYRSDPISGDIRVSNLSYNGFILDPFFRKHDLSDCSFIMTRKYLEPNTVISLIPHASDLIKSMRGGAYFDGKFQYMPEAYNYNMENLLTYDEFWYRTYRKQKLLVDMVSGETQEWAGSADDLKVFLGAFPQITTIEQEIPSTNLAIRVQSTCVYNGPNPLGIDAYPFVPVLGYYEPQIPYFPYRIQGVVRGLRDAQFLYNRRKVIELDILESQLNSGWKYKENALVNPDDVFLAGQGKGLALKQEASMADVERIQPSQVPPSMIELSKILGEEITQISGVNEELLGSATDDKAGILSMLRQGSGLTTLQILLDQLDSSQIQLGNLFISLIQANFAPGKVKRVLGKEPTSQFFNRNFGRYDAVVEEGMFTLTQRQMNFTQLVHLRELGVPVPSDVLVESATLQDKGRLVEGIERQEQIQAQSQQRMARAQENLIEAKTKDLFSRAEANAGLGLERASRTVENRALAVERLAASEKDRTLGILHLAKTLKELEGMDIAQIERLLYLSKVLEAETSPEAEMDQLKVETPTTEELFVATEGENNGQKAEEIQGNQGGPLSAGQLTPGSNPIYGG